MLVEVPLVKRKCGSADMTKAMVAAWKTVVGSDPTKEQIGCLYAQWCTETGGAQGSSYCYNVTNIKISYKYHSTCPEPIKFYKLPGTWEMIGGKRVVLDVEDPGSWFRAFDTLEEGTEFYVRFLAKHKYFDGCKSGDPELFGKMLHDGGFYTAPVDVYSKGLRQHFTRFMANTWFEDASEPPPYQGTPEPINVIHNDTIPDDHIPATLQQVEDAAIEVSKRIDWGKVWAAVKNFVNLLLARYRTK